MRSSIACAGPTTRTSREEPVSTRLRACLTAAATAVLLTGCVGAADIPTDRSDPSGVGIGGEDPARTNHLGYPDGVAPAEGLTLVEALGLYVVAPAAILLLVAALVWLPGMVRSSRYRPGRGWGAAPLWFGGPPDPAAAVESASTGDVVRGGASGDW